MTSKIVYLVWPDIFKCLMGISTCLVGIYAWTASWKINPLISATHLLLLNCPLSSLD